jgi:hypothetical protein
LVTTKDWDLEPAMQLDRRLPMRAFEQTLRRRFQQRNYQLLAYEKKLPRGFEPHRL